MSGKRASGLCFSKWALEKVGDILPALQGPSIAVEGRWSMHRGGE